MTELLKSGLSFKLHNNSSKLSKKYDKKTSLCRSGRCLNAEHTQNVLINSHHSNNCTCLEKEITQSSNEFYSFRSARAQCTCLLSGLISDHTKTLLCVRWKASITVEAALVVPFFLLAIVLFLGLFQVMKVELQVNQALSYTVSKMAAEVIDPDFSQLDESTRELLDQGVLIAQYGKEKIRGRTVFTNQLKQLGIRTSDLAGGFAGVELKNSASDEEYVRMTVEYAVALPINVFGKKQVEISQTAVARRWIGDAGGKDTSGEWVYITPFGTAYHSTTGCPFLDLSLLAVTELEVAFRRNSSGGKYYPCQICKNTGSAETVYITDHGTLYHRSLDCLCLKRTILRVRKEQAENRSACEKCYIE